jgi:Tfp pilus assembly protein PilX
MIASPRRLRRSVRRARNRGIALPVVLLISAMMLTTSAAWFEQTVAAARNSAGIYDHLTAMHAADSALSACARKLIDGSLTGALGTSDASGEPVGWKSPATFESSAIAPFASWPTSLSVRPPQCLIETWRLSNRANAQAYLVTARGYGRSVDSQMWLQLQMVIDGNAVERHWRRIAARPF